MKKPAIISRQLILGLKIAPTNVIKKMLMLMQNEKFRVSDRKQYVADLWQVRLNLFTLKSH